MKNRAVFLDRDGTINAEVGYLDSFEKLVIIPAAYEAVQRINRLGFKAIVITNQSGVARGLFDEDFVRRLHRHISHLFQSRGAVIDGFYYCPHHPTEGKGPYLRQCECRKPAPGLLLKAAREWNIDLGASYMVGDQAKDVELIKRVGGKGILISTGPGPEAETLACEPDFLASDILEAVKWIEGDLKGEYSDN